MGNSDTLMKRAQQIHEDNVVVAVHTDVIGDVAERHSKGEKGVLKSNHTERFKQGGISCICDHVIGDTFETQSFPSAELLHAYNASRPYNPSLLKHSLKNLEYMLEDIEESSSEWALATTVDEMISNASNDMMSIVLCLQGCTPLEDEPSLLKLYYRLGLRILNMVSSYSNAAVGSQKDEHTWGLTKLGRAIVEHAQNLNMVIDAGSMSKQGFWDIVDLVEGPFIVSLGNAYGVHDYRGNLTDKQLEALAGKNGVIALIANGKLVTGKPQVTIGDFVDHIDYIVNLIGIDCIGIGPDIVEDGMYPIETYRRMFADEGWWSAVYPEGFSTHAELHNVTLELLKRGYSDNDVSKILGGNILRVYKEVWGR